MIGTAWTEYATNCDFDVVAVPVESILLLIPQREKQASARFQWHFCCSVVLL